MPTPALATPAPAASLGELSWNTLEPTLSKFWKAYKPQIAGAGIGAGLGAGAMALRNALSDDEGEDASPMRGVLSGGALGGLAGLGAGSLYNGATAQEDRGGWTKLFNSLGAGVLSPLGVGAGAMAAPSMVSKSKGLLDTVTKQHGEKIKELRDRLSTAVSPDPAHVIPPNAVVPHGVTAFQNPRIVNDRTVQDRLKSHIESMLGNNSRRNSLARMLGADQSTHAIDASVMDELLGTVNTPGVAKPMQDILRDAPKHIRDAYEAAATQGNTAARNIIRGHHRNAMWRRGAAGAGAAWALPKVVDFFTKHKPEAEEAVNQVAKGVR